MFTNVRVLEDLPHEPMDHGWHDFDRLPRPGVSIVVKDPFGGRMILEVTQVLDQHVPVDFDDQTHWTPEPAHGRYALHTRLRSHVPVDDLTVPTRTLQRA